MQFKGKDKHNSGHAHIGASTAAFVTRDLGEGFLACIHAEMPAANILLRQRVGACICTVFLRTEDYDTAL